MKTAKTLFLCGLVSLMAAEMSAEPVTYIFTGHRTGGDSFFGETITGTAVVDVDSTSGEISDIEGLGQVGQWYGGAFSLNVLGDNGSSWGTNFGGVSYMSVFDFPGLSNIEYQLNWYTLLGMGFQTLSLSSWNTTPEDGLATIPDPWELTSFQNQWLRVENFQPDGNGGGEFGLSFYSIDTWQRVATNIVIDGFDTGMVDFTFQGEKVSAILAGYAEAATNHGSFVSQVKKLASALRKAGLLTDDQRKILTNAAVQSRIGK